MSGNPNLMKIGRRKVISNSKQPEWLFPSPTEKSTPHTPQSTKYEVSTKDQKKSKKDSKLEPSSLKNQAGTETLTASTSSQLIELINAYLTNNKYTGASRALKAERKKRGDKTQIISGTPPLDAIFSEWLNLKGSGKTTKIVSASNNAPSGNEASAKDSDVEMADVAAISKFSNDSSSSSSSGSSSSSDSDADDEEEIKRTTIVLPTKAKVNELKRKAPGSDSSSSSDSTSSDSSSSESDLPRKKKTKSSVAKSDSSSSSSSSDSDSSSDEQIVHKASKEVSDSSSSSSSSGSDSGSDSDSQSASSTQSAARKFPLPVSDSGSESDSSSSDSSSDLDTPTTSQKKARSSSDTSATLSDTAKKQSDASSNSSSSDLSSSSESETENQNKKPAKASGMSITRPVDPPLPPEPALKVQKKKVNEPFSRIKKDQVVDARLSSNAYVPYDYAQKAHEDLIVTRGKGFTKEKNKKKRGSYRGGFIDVDGKKGIKFDD